MGTISLTAPVSGNTITAAVFSNAYTIVQNVLNGNLDTANFASGQIFDTSRIMQGGGDTRHVIGWDGTNWNPRAAPSRFFDTTLSSSAVSIDIPNIPQTHQGLLCVVYARGDGTTDGMYVRVNGDSGANYDIQFNNAAASSASAAETFATSEGMFGFPVSRSTGPANVFTAIVFEIPNYANTTNHKAGTGRSAYKNGTTSNSLEARHTASFWRSTAAINQITLRNQAGNYVAGTRASLYLMP